MYIYIYIHVTYLHIYLYSNLVYNLWYTNKQTYYGIHGQGWSIMVTSGGCITMINGISLRCHQTWLAGKSHAIPNISQSVDSFSGKWWETFKQMDDFSKPCWRRIWLQMIKLMVKENIICSYLPSGNLTLLWKITIVHGQIHYS